MKRGPVKRTPKHERDGEKCIAAERDAKRKRMLAKLPPATPINYEALGGPQNEKDSTNGR
jgi:hypothetical protein